jgi:hypothetical protein
MMVLRHSVTRKHGSQVLVLPSNVMAKERRRPEFHSLPMRTASQERIALAALRRHHLFAPSNALTLVNRFLGVSP